MPAGIFGEVISEVYPGNDDLPTPSLCNHTVFTVSNKYKHSNMKGVVMNDLNLKIRRMVYLGIMVVIMMVVFSLIGKVTTTIKMQKNETAQEVGYEVK